MDPAPIEDLKLAALLDAELRALPPLRAPATLQARVLAELARRRALPWWRQGFRGWPLAAQCGFALLPFGLLHLALASPAGVVLGWIVAALRDRALVALHGVEALASGVAILVAVAGDLLAAVPSQWLVIPAMAALGSLALLLASGTLVYRTLLTRS